MERKTNRRGYEYNSTEYRHLKLRDLKTKAQHLRNQYLVKDNMLDISNDEPVNGYSIPPYPRPEFHVTRLKHDTNREGLKGIRTGEGFKDPFDSSLLWWSLSVGPEEVASAERRLLETTYPDRTEEQESFLDKFASSPVFLKSSMYGSYRFTLSLEEVLKAYRDQFCGGAEPVMRVLRTDLYRQEVMYAVVVHGPDHQHLYGHHPLLTDEPDSVCAYRDGHFLWRSEAMCGTHSYHLVRRDDEKQMRAESCKGIHEKEHYVWDNVAVALHVDNKVLKFDVDRLRESLTFCDEAEISVGKKRKNPFDSYEEAKGLGKKSHFDSYEEADKLMRELWPSALKRDDEVKNVDKDGDGDEDDVKDGDGDEDDVKDGDGDEDDDAQEFTGLA